MKVHCDHCLNQTERALTREIVVMDFEKRFCKSCLENLTISDLMKEFNADENKLKLFLNQVEKIKFSDRPPRKRQKYNYQYSLNFNNQKPIQ